jgi:ribosomal protein S18 acetylase RimI-like enzyme
MLGRAAGVSRPEEGDGAVRATDWVAHWRGFALGRVQLVVQADQADPWAGHWLSSLSVRSVVRGFGIGAALTGAVVEHARGDGAVEVLLAVHEDNARAIALYRKLGFERVVLHALEPLLADELERLGRRRVVMRLPLAACA